MQDLVKKIAERYGLKYDENQENPTVRLEDGTIKEIKKEDFEKAFE